MDNADFVADLYPVGTDWYSLGVFLNIETQALDHIYEQFGSSGIHRCLCELYKLLVSTKRKCSWSDVADALSTMKNHTLSEIIRQKHPVIPVGRYDADDHASHSSDTAPALFVDSDIAQCYEDMQARFTNLVIKVMNALRQSGIAKKLVDLQVLLHRHFGLEPLPPKEATVEAIFLRMQGHCSFLNHKLLLHLFQNFANSKKFKAIKQELDAYSQSLEEFKSSKEMGALMQIMGKRRKNSVGSEYKIVWLKLKGEWIKRTLKEFETFTKLVFQSKFEQLIDIHVTDGCILISWLVYHSFTNTGSIFFADDGKCDSLSLLKVLGCIFLQVGDHLIYEESIESTSHTFSFDEAVSAAIMRNDVWILEAILAVAYTSHEYLRVMNFFNVEVDGLNIFHVACSLGHVDLVKALLNASRCNPDVLTIDGKTPLMFACENGHSDVVKALLVARNNVTVNSYTIDGFTALHFAVKNNFLITISLLLEFGANPNSMTNDGWTPLLFASSNNYTEAALLLLRANCANPNSHLKSGMTSIYFACNHGNAILTHYLLEHGANLEIMQKEYSLHRTIDDSYTPLLLAFERGHKDVVDILLQEYERQSINSSHCLHNQTSDLIIASQLGKYDSVCSLLSGGANPDSRMTGGWSPMMFASFNNRGNVITELLNKDANPNICNEEGLTPLMLACVKGNKDIVTTLLKTNIAVNACTKNGTTALHLASFSGYSTIVSLLLCLDADVNFQNVSGISALMFAARNKHNEVASELMKIASINLNLPSKNNQTALYFASEAGDSSIVKNLLLAGSYPNICCNDSWSPLMIASSRGHTKVVKKLLKHPDIDKNKHTPQGLTALQLAINGDHLVVADMLKQFDSVSDTMNQSMLPLPQGLQLRNNPIPTTFQPFHEYDRHSLSSQTSSCLTDFYGSHLKLFYS